MHEESSHKGDLLDNYNKKEYRERFGILFSSKSTKDIMNFSDINKTSNVKYKKGNSIRSSYHRKNPFDLKTNSNILINDIHQLELDKLYKNFSKEDEEILPIRNFNKINNCSILKYGIKESIEEIKYSYCKTCDHNLVRPICYPCINECHKGHLIKTILKKGKIKCFCGERNHFQNQVNNNVIDHKNINCFCNEWNIIAKLGFYYVNKDKDPICILCHNYCVNDNKKDKIIKIEENKNIPNCTCKNIDIHKTHKVLCEKIISLITDYNEFHILLHPIKFINMLFKSKNSFKLIFEDFEIFTNNLKNLDKSKITEFFSKYHSIDVTNTNTYKTLLIFEKMIQKKAKNNYIYYFNDEILNYFSFDIVKKLFFILEKSSSEEKSFRILIIKYLYLFHKFYINIKTQTLSKFKLNDLKNLSFLQRIVIFNKNKKIFNESEEIISFLLKILTHIIYKLSSSIESLECIKEIMAIFRKLACYNLISNEQMTNICINIIKCFNFIRLIRNLLSNTNNCKATYNSKKSNYDLKHLNKVLLKLYYVIMKMIYNFIYNYNDNILNLIIFNKEKYPNINNINLDNVCFIFKKNELGKLIFKINISILSNLQNNYNSNDNKKIITCQRIGMEILQYSLNGNDNYILNIIDSLNKVKFYFNNSQKLNINNNPYYKEMLKQCSLLLKAFYQYFNFEKSIEELLIIVNKSLNFIFGETSDKILYLDENEKHEIFNNNQIIAFLSTNFINIISRVIGIIHHYQNRKKIFNNNKKTNNIKLNLFIKSLPFNIEDEIIKKILYFFNCFAFNSSDNSILILSHSLFIELTKVPIKYCQLSFKLFYLSIKNILTLDNSESSINIIIEQRHIIKKLYNYLDKLFEDKNIKQNSLLTCLYFFLQIINITLFNSHSSFYNNFIYKVQYILTSINKKYNLINKYFEMKDNELISNAKNNNVTLDFSNNDIQDFKNENNNFEFFERNILKKNFVIYIKLINNCFDFSIETDRKKIEEMININKVIFSLIHYKINLDLRTEFLRLIKKILLDIKYSSTDNRLYVKTIINSQDNLIDIKSNPLITNMEYPTKLLSFLADFYNITSKCTLIEKIKKKYKNEKLKSEKNLLNFNNKAKQIELFNKNYFEKSINKLSINPDNELSINKSIRNSITDLDISNDDEHQKENNNELTISITPNVKNNKNEQYLTNDINIIMEESNSKMNIESDEETKSQANNSLKINVNEDSKKIKNCSSNKLNLRITQKRINKSIKIVNNKDNKRSSCFNISKGNSLESKKQLINLNILNKRKSLISMDDDININNKKLEKLMKIIKNNNDEQLCLKCKDINILEDAFNKKFYNIINFELDHIKKNIENIKLNSPEKIESLRNYFENGLLIPIIFYFKKIFTLVHFFTGEEMIKLFALVKKAIKLKIFISEFRIDFWQIYNDDKQKNIEKNINMYLEENEIINSQNNYTIYKNPSIIDGTYFTDRLIELTYESLEYIKSHKISIFDYTSLYQIINKELFSLIKNRTVLNILNNFKEKNHKSLNKKINNEEKKLLNGKNHIPALQKRLLKVLIIYKYSKLTCFNENNSSILNILPEITLGYETNYRNLLINLLINYGKEIDIKNEFVDNSYFLLFKLLSLHTTEIQNDIINLLGGENKDNSGFLKQFSNILFYRIILLLIDYLNTPDKLIKSNYFVCCNIIYIFKLLCKEHNNFFQKHFIRSLSFACVQGNFSYFIYKKNKENIDSSLSDDDDDDDDDEESKSNIMYNNEKNKEYNINFYDFFLYLLTKIILISNWEYNYRNDYQHQNPFLYDLFSSIIDLLTEIIQGCEPDLLSSLCINLEEGVMDIIEDGMDLERFKKIDSFEVFIKTIKNILFQDKYNIEFLNEIRSNIIHFITSILEEKNCNEIMKKYIKRYININNVYKIISTIMKSYYLNKEKYNNSERNKKSVVDLIEKNISKKKFKKKVGLKRKNSYFPIYRPKIKKIHKTIKNRLSFDGNITSSNIKLINNSSSSIYKDINKKYSFLNIEKFKTMKKEEETILNNKNTFKKIQTQTIIDYKRESKLSELEISNLIFGKKLYNFFKNQFYQNMEFTEQFEFRLSNSFYRYIKNIRFHKKEINKKLIYEEIKMLIDIEDDLFLNNHYNNNKSIKKYRLNISNYDKDLLEKYYIEKFFEDITSKVEICTNEGINKFVIYTKLPVMQFLSKETKIDFKENVNRDNETTKKYDLIRYIQYFLKEIKYYKKYHNKWDFWFLKIDFYYLDVLSYLVALINNLILLFTLEGDNQITNFNLKERHQNKYIIQNLIDTSINKWSLTYKVISYFYLLLNGVLIILWIFFKLPLYYRIDQIKYREIFKIYKNRKLCFYDKIYILFKMNFFGRNYIFLLIYEFIINIICLSIKNSHIIYSFLLLPIFYLNKTLKNIMTSIRLNFIQFCLTFCLAFIIIYIFSNFYFFFYNSDFIVELNYHNDNYCKTLIFSFLNALDNGLRARGGIGDSAKRISYIKNKNHYLFRLILDDLFFLLIVIIMIDLVFGIILKSFDELRHRSQKDYSDKKNYCLICHSNRGVLEKMRINFNDHVKIVHNIWNYVEYMISLKLRDIHDLNAINQYVRSKMDKNDISWLPKHKDEFKKNDNYNDIDDNNIIVYLENFDNYKIKVQTNLTS